MRTLSRFLLAGAGALAAVAVGAGGLFATHQTADAAQTSGVSIKNFAFAPATVKIKAGDTVRWINDESNVPHDITSETYGQFASPALRPGESFFQTFDKAGAYPYFCIIHPRMRGIVLVGDATGEPSVAAAAPAAAPITLRLQGSGEVPALTTDANGVFAGTLDTAARTMKFQLQAAGVGLTMAHIHTGAPGTNGPVVAFLFGPKPEGVNLINESGTITPANLVGPLAGAKWDEFVQAVQSGNAYVNVHSIKYPAGEIRAQIGTAPRPPATGTGLASGGSGTGDWAFWTVAALAFAAAGIAFELRPRHR